MKNTDIFQIALGLADPWIVESAEFDPIRKRLDIRIDFKKGGTFDCPACGVAGCKAHDAQPFGECGLGDVDLFG